MSNSPSIRTIDNLLSEISARRNGFSKAEKVTLEEYFNRGKELVGASVTFPVFLASITNPESETLSDTLWGAQAIYAARIADSLGQTGAGLFNSFKDLFGGHASRPIFEEIRSTVEAACKIR